MLGALAAFASGRPPQAAAIGEPIRQDDFLYTVVGVAKMSSLGDDGRKTFAHGTFYVVSVDVENQARRVDYRWDPSIVYVVDAQGRRYQVALAAQEALEAAHPVDAIVPAGSSARFAVAFDLPRGIDHPALAFSNGILMGDIFNAAAYMRVRVPLD